MIIEAGIFTKFDKAIIKSNKEANAPLEWLTGETPDISEYMNFQFWDGVLYYKERAETGVNKIGQFLQMASNVGNSMCYNILPDG